MNETRRIPELDGIRGCAIALVLFWHYIVAPLDTPPESVWHHVQALGRLTWSGVDLFFVLSGFLIGGILLDTRDSPNYFRTFYARRFFRIVPLYVAVLCIALAANHGKIDEQIPTVTYFLFLQNFWMALHGTFGYLLSPTWSLAVEEQFYLTLPGIVRYINRGYLAYVFGAGILLAPVLRMLCYHLWPHNTIAYYVLMPCRADALLLGALAAVAMRDARASLWLRSHGRTLFAALLIFAIGFVVLTKYCLAHPFLLISAGYSWMALMYLCVILCAVTQPQSWLAGFLRLGVLRWLGSIAYGVYLFHFLIETLIFREVYHSREMHLHTLGQLGAMAFALALTLVICQLSWMYFEKPLLQLGHRHRYARKPA